MSFVTWKARPGWLTRSIFMLGARAKSGTLAAPQVHTAFPGLEWNGEPVGEIGMIAAYAAVLGVPLVFIGGDRAAHLEAVMTLWDC